MSDCELFTGGAKGVSYQLPGRPLVPKKGVESPKLFAAGTHFTMGNSASSSDSEEDVKADSKADDSLSDTEADQEKDASTSLDLQSLFDPEALRMAATKVKDEMPENIIQEHQSTLVRWLEERQQRHEETVTLAQFCDVLMYRSVSREDSIQAFMQFDSEGDGTADVSAMLEALKVLSSNSLYGDLGYTVRTLQACSLTPGFLDVFSEDKKSVGNHGGRILNFLLRNRAPAHLLPFPILSGFNNSCAMRLAALKAQMSKVKDSASRQQQVARMLCEGEELKPITRCFKTIEVSSNKADAYRLTNGDPFGYWQSDGAARSHWIRLRMRNNVVIQQLTVSVSSSDQSYMPQTITVSVGKNYLSLREIKEVRVPSHAMGDVTVLENCKSYYPVIQINIKRCHTDGCDTRIHSLKTLGYRIVKEHGVSVLDASAAWYLQVLSSLATACIPVAPNLRHNILDHTKTALSHMPPLSLSPTSADRPTFLSNHVMLELSKFLGDISVNESGMLTEDGLFVTLSFNLARGQVAAILKTLLQMKEYPELELPGASLIRLMNSVRDAYWKRMGSSLQVSLCGCDGGQKEDSLEPEALLTANWAGTQAYISNQGKTLVNMFFKTADHVQLTKVRIKVDRGAKGARRGMVFVYKESGEFNLEKHVEKFKGYDSWTASEYVFCQRIRASGIGGKPDNPVGYFALEEDWDEVEVSLDLCPVGQYVLVKFLEPRDSSADRLAVMGIKFHGFVRKGVFVEGPTEEIDHVASLKEKTDMVPGHTIVLRCLHFLVSLARDQVPTKKVQAPIRKGEVLDLADVSVELLWKLYSSYTDGNCQNLSLQLLHALFSSLTNGKTDSSKDSSESLFKHLCAVVDNTKPSSPLEEHLVRVTKQVIIDGAAVFFPDKEARRKQLFSMMNDINATTQSASVSLIFQSLCQFFSSVDPSGLLDLPTELNKDFNMDPMMAVMETLLSVAFREFEKFLAEESRGEKTSHLVHLYCALQTSLLAWCTQMTESEDKLQSNLAQQLLARYVDMVANKATEGMQEIYKEKVSKWTPPPVPEPAASAATPVMEEGQEKGNLEANRQKSNSNEEANENEDKDKDKNKENVEKTNESQDEMVLMFKRLEGSFIATALRQMILVVSSLKEVVSSRTRRQLLASLHPLMQELHRIGLKLPHLFLKVDSPQWRRLEAGEVVLRTWELESPHNYENNQNITQTFSCPGASLFIVEFDARCETEKRYDYLEFTDSRGIKTRYDQKVGSDKWPNLVTFRGGHRLQFLFHSDGTNNEWGYKFKVTAKGCPDVPLCWMFDLQLSIVLLHGHLCGKTLASNRVSIKKLQTGDVSEDVEAEQLRHLLWTTLFRGGYTVGKLQRSLSGKHEALSDSCVRGLLWALVEDEKVEGQDRIAAEFLAKCREHCTYRDIGGPEIAEAVIAIFAALLWHTQLLREDLDKYVKSNGESRISEGIYQAYNVAESMRTMLMDQRQKWKLANEQEGSKKVTLNPVTPCRDKALFLLKFAGLSKVLLKSESKGKLSRQTSRHTRIQGIPIEKSIKLDSVMEKHPSFRLVLDFVRDPAWSKDRVEEILEERLHQADAVASAYMTAAETLRILADEHPFQVPSVVFLQSMLSHQEHFPQHYADGLDGCGLLLESQVRRSYYTLIRRLIDSLGSVKRSSLTKPVVSSYDYIQACTLHLLDMNWQQYDLSFLVDIKLPEFYINLAKGSVSVREKHICECDTDKELSNYKRDLNWLEECFKDFSGWFNACEKAPTAQRKEMQMFIARFCDLLDVEINCNACDLTLPGHRYRCLKCLDTDYCSTCYAGGVTDAGEHCNDHEIVHMMYKCDECKAFIVGTRIHCKVCEDFDLCLGCHDSGVFPAGHNAEHPVTRHPMVTWKLSKDFDMSMLSYLHQHAWLLMTSLALSMSHVIYQPRRQELSTEVDSDYVQASVSLHNSCIELVNGCLMQVNSSDYLEEDDSAEVLALRQQEAFAVHSQERIMGLLGAMVPPENKVPISDEVNSTFTSQDFLHMLFTIARGESGHESNTQHMAMGLVGQLLQRTTTTCSIADGAVALATAKPVSENAPEGQHTVEFLFNFGATCLERSGLEWAHSMAGILQRLFNSVAWRDMLLQHISSCIQTLTRRTQADVREDPAVLFQKVDVDGDGLISREEMKSVLEKYKLEEEEITILWEVCRLPQMEKMEQVGFGLALQVCELRGTEELPHITKSAAAAALLTDKEEKEVIPELSNIFALFVIAGFPEVLSLGSHVKYSDVGTEMKDAVVLKHSPEKKTSLLIDKKNRKRIWSKDDYIEIVSYDSHVLDKEHMVAFIEIVKDIGIKVKKGFKVSVESLWVLSLSVKTLLHSLQAGPTQDAPELVGAEFLQSVVYLASMGTKFSRQWLLKDLEILSLTLYTRDREKTEEKEGEEGAVKPPKQDSSTEKGLSDDQVNFMNLLKRYGIPEPNQQSIIFEVIRKFKLEDPSSATPASTNDSQPASDHAIDTGMQIDTTTKQPACTTVEEAADEPCEATQKLIASPDNDSWSENIKQRKTKSAALLRKELDAQGKAASRDFLVKVNTALSVLYARNLLMTLLADWPAEDHMITAQLIGCKDSAQVPFVLDLLNHTEVRDAFEKVVNTVISRSPQEALVPLALTACGFMSEVNLSTAIGESLHDYQDSTTFEDKIHIPGASVLVVKFDSRCCTEESCDVLVLSSSPDYMQDKHVFSGPREKWIDFEIPGDMLYYKFTSDCSNNDWGYRFTVTGGKIGRFDTGYCILNSVLSLPNVTSLLPLEELWPRLVQVACKQFGQQRMKALQLMLKMMAAQFKSAGCKELNLDLGLLRPLWQLYNKMSASTTELGQIISPVSRALTEFFLLAENLAMEWNMAEKYMASLLNDKEIQSIVFQGVINVAAVSLMVGHSNKATEGIMSLNEKKEDKTKEKEK